MSNEIKKNGEVADETMEKVAGGLVNIRPRGACPHCFNLGKISFGEVIGTPIECDENGVMRELGTSYRCYTCNQGYID